MLDVLKTNLAQAQSKMKVVADGHRHDVQFEKGDMVYLKF